jgi:hypothetical protein
MRRSLVSAQYADISIRRQCELFNIHRSGVLVIGSKRE